MEVELAATNGVSLGANDRVVGTPSASGSFQVPVSVQQPNGQVIHRELSWTVHLPPLIDEPDTIELQQGQAVQRGLKVQHGTPPFRWQLAGGTLPLGVVLNENGQLQGVRRSWFYRMSGAGDRSVGCTA